MVRLKVWGDCNWPLQVKVETVAASHPFFCVSFLLSVLQLPSAHQNHRESGPVTHRPVLTFQPVVNWFWEQASDVHLAYLLFIRACFREPKTCATTLVTWASTFLSCSEQVQMSRVHLKLLLALELACCSQVYKELLPQSPGNTPKPLGNFL